MKDYRLKFGNFNNDKQMVLVLKTWLNDLLPNPQLTVNDTFDLQTASKLQTFRFLNDLSDGEIVCDAATWLTLAQEIRSRGSFSNRSPSATTRLPQVLQKMMNPDTTCPLKIDRQKFFDAYRKEFGKLNQSQTEGLDQFLGFIEADKEMCDVRWVAYVLATVYVECSKPPAVWKPIPENDKGRSQKTHFVKRTGKREVWYGTPKTIKCDGVEYTQVFYGRGYVQLTHGDTYLKVSQLLGYGCEFVKNPDRVLEPEISYKILSYCMRNGEAYANGHKLSDYFNEKKTDYLRARAIINGTNRRREIAGYAKKFQAMIELSGS